MASTRYGKTFRTRRGRHGRYKYVNGRRVGFVSSGKPKYGNRRFNWKSMRKGQGYRNAQQLNRHNRYNRRY